MTISSAPIYAPTTTLPCAACGSRRIATALENLAHTYTLGASSAVWRYRLNECRDCGLGFVDPKPNWALLQTFYDEDYGPYQSHPISPESAAASLKYRIARLRLAGWDSKHPRALARRGLGLLAEWLTGRTVCYTLSAPLQLPKEASVFDLGYGSGDWLLTMASLGYRNLHGYDIPGNTRNRSKLLAAGVHITDGVFLQDTHPLGAFDCIRLNHVFEHLLDPVQVLRKCRRMLRPGGVLVMGLPCKSSWAMRLSPLHSPTLQLPKHLYHHTPVSARLMVEAAGLVPLQVRAYSVAAQLGGTVNGLLASRNRKTLPPSLFSATAPVYKLFSELTRSGDFMSVLARRAAP